MGNFSALERKRGKFIPQNIVCFFRKNNKFFCRKNFKGKRKKSKRYSFNSKFSIVLWKIEEFSHDFRRCSADEWPKSWAIERKAALMRMCGLHLFLCRWRFIEFCEISEKNRYTIEVLQKFTVFLALSLLI